MVPIEDKLTIKNDISDVHFVVHLHVTFKAKVKEKSERSITTFMLIPRAEGTCRKTVIYTMPQKKKANQNARKPLYRQYTTESSHRAPHQLCSTTHM